MSEDLKYSGTVRARVGYAARDWLIYATGGLAFAQVNYGYSVSEPDTSSTGLVSASEHKSGWTLGGGAEIRMDQRWSLKGEYLFYDLGDEHLTAPIFAEGVAVGVEVPSSFKTQGNVARVGLNYHFDYEPPPEPLK